MHKLMAVSWLAPFQSQKFSTDSRFIFERFPIWEWSRHLGLGTLVAERKMLPTITKGIREASTANKVVAFFDAPAMVHRRVKRMTAELKALIEAARTRPFPEEEREAQRRSFAYGNAKIENDRITWEMIIEADERIKAEIKAGNGR